LPVNPASLSSPLYENSTPSIPPPLKDGGKLHGGLSSGELKMTFKKKFSTFPKESVKDTQIVFSKVS